MAFAGKNSNIFTNGNNMSKFLRKITTTFNSDVHDTTVFNNPDKLFTPTLRHATLACEGFYEAPNATQSDAFFNNIINTTSVWSFYEAGSAFGNLGIGMKTIETKYEIVSAVEAVAILTVDGQITESRDIITSLHSYANIISASGTTTQLDNGSSSNKGGQGYVHVDNLTGTMQILPKIQHSSGGAFTDLIVFTSGGGTYGQKVTLASNTGVKRFVRAAWLVGNAGTIVCNIGFRRN